MPALKGYTIPIKLLMEFTQEPRIVIKKNWPGLYPIDPGILAKINPESLKQLLNTHDIIISPKEEIGV